MASKSTAGKNRYIQEVDSFIRSHKSFNGNDPTSFRASISTIVRACPPTPALLAKWGTIESFLQHSSDRFILHSNSARVGVATLTPFRGEEGHRVFGEYRCTCGRTWSSAGSYCDRWQQCQACQTRIYPFRQRALEQQSEAEFVDDDREPHDTSRCEQCRRLGRNCMPHRAATGRFS